MNRIASATVSADVLGPRDAPSRLSRQAVRARRRRAEAREARVLELVLFPLFLFAAIVAPLLPGRGWRAPQRTSSTSRRSIFTDARAMASEVIPFVFVR